MYYTWCWENRWSFSTASAFQWRHQIYITSWHFTQSYNSGTFRVPSLLGRVGSLKYNQLIIETRQSVVFENQQIFGVWSVLVREFGTFRVPSLLSVGGTYSLLGNIPRLQFLVLEPHRSSDALTVAFIIDLMLLFFFFRNPFSMLCKINNKFQIVGWILRSYTTVRYWYNLMGRDHHSLSVLYCENFCQQ